MWVEAILSEADLAKVVTVGAGLAYALVRWWRVAA